MKLIKKFLNKKDAHLLPARKREASHEAGFTLIETSIAMVMMMVVAMGAASLFFMSITNNTGASERAMSVAIAQRRIEWLRALPYNDPDAGDPDIIGLPDDEVMDPAPEIGGRSFTVRTLVSGTDTLKTITVIVAPNGRGPEWARGGVTFTTQRAAKVIGPNR